MIRLKTRPFLTGALLFSAALASFQPAPAAAQTGFATQVLDYTPGTVASTTYTNAASALGQPGGNVGSGTLNPFSPNYAASELTEVGQGGELTLGLSNFVIVGAAGVDELGIFGNVGLINTSTGGGGAGGTANPATVFGNRAVQIAVSADGVHFVALNGGGLITSTLPANYYANATGINDAPPANPTLANFGQPFTGTLASFNNETFAQTLGTLNGSAGGTWLDLSATGLSQVAYVRFTEPTSGGVGDGVFYLNGVSLNGALLGAAVPEPSALALAALVMGGVLGWMARRRVSSGRRAAGVVLGVVLALGGWSASASAQMFGFADITNWTGTGSNEAAVVIDWNDGKMPESIAWGYRWNGVATGLDMLQAVDLADPRLVVFTVNDPNFGAFVYGMGYDLNNNGGTFTPGTPGDATTENGSASDPGDHYAEGFNTKYWAYFNSDNGSPYGGGGGLGLR